MGKLSKNFIITSYDIDVNGRLSLPSLCHYFQEIAWEHANLLQFGYEFLNSIQQFWVLSRIQIKIDQYPKWKEEITVTTWPKGIDGLFALRDFNVCDIEGNQLASATSSWLILDQIKRRPQRIDSDDHPKYEFVTENALINSAEKLSKPENLNEIDQLKVKFSDIDINKHVNNVRYLQWAIDAVLDEKHLNNTITDVIINFLGEASIGDTLQLSDYVNDNIHLISITHDQKDLCRLKLTLN